MWYYKWELLRKRTVFILYELPYGLYYISGKDYRGDYNGSSQTDKYDFGYDVSVMLLISDFLYMRTVFEKGQASQGKQASQIRRSHIGA